MEQVITKDGSVTFRNEEYDETYHSVSAGGLKEAQVKFIDACEISDNKTILDVGFGLGYNILAAIHGRSGLTVYSLEKDPQVFEMVQTVDVPPELKTDYKKIQQAALDKKYEDERCAITIFVGDALEQIDSVPEGIDAVFFDAFSPQKNPELWTQDFFQKIYDKMKTGGRLATYSCATHVRQKLKAVGFTVIDGPILGRKSPATIAVK